jgi:hypothetical protein
VDGDGVSVYDLNNWGQVVGRCLVNGQQRAFLFDPATDDANDPIGRAVDLNDIVDPATIPTNWIIKSALGINDRGEIAGYLVSPDGAIRRGCIIETNATDQNGMSIAPQLHLVPNESLGPDSYVRAINEDGSVLGNYRDGDVTRSFVYNPGWHTEPFLQDIAISPIIDMVRTISDVHIDGQGNTVDAMVAGRDSLGAFRVSLDAPNSPEIFPWGPAGSWAHNYTGGTVTVMNAKGTFGGECWLEAADGGLEYAPFLVRADGTWRQLEAGVTKTRYPNISSPAAINSSEDVVLGNFATYGSALSLHHADLHDGFESLELNDLVVGTRSNVIGTDSDVDIWFDSLRTVRAMSDRAEVVDSANITDLHFGEIVGDMALTDSRGNVIGGLGFMLTPVPVP